MYGGNSQHVGRAGSEPSPAHRGAREGAGALSFTADVGPDSCGVEPHGGSEDGPNRHPIGGSDSERLNLSTLDRREQLLPFLQWISSPAERQYIAGKIFEHVRSGPGSVSHVGEISQIRVPIHDVLRTRGLTELQARAHQVQSARPGMETIPLLDSTEVARLKPFFVVRDKLQFRNQLILWSFLFFLSFWAVHIFWSVRGTGGPQYVLPSVLLLSGVGLTLMITLRDPVRDTLAFSTFAQGVAGGCVVLAIASTLDYRRISGKLSYVFLIASFLLSAGLILFGSGPTGSDAKVNLLGFQPAEVIRVLIVFFLAGYFAERWEFLRTLRDQRKGLEKISRWVEVPRLDYLLPVVGGIVVSLAFFFLQKDLGPALLIACLFLAMYAIARDRYLFALVGMVVILAGFASGYFLGFPRNVAGRVSMWLSPWDNSVRGGEQVAHSLWAFATGGVFGTGLGLGDPQWMPAAHTDLILAALGEEWGFLGVTAVLALYAALVWFGIRAALGARSDYNFFLALGLTLAFALQILLIAGGVLGLIPLSGVVVPFLSYGRTGLITNFAIIGILFSLSREVSRNAGHEYDRAFSRQYTGTFLRDCRARRLPAGEGVLHPGDPCRRHCRGRCSRAAGGWRAPLRVQPSSARSRALDPPWHDLRPQRNSACDQQLE